MKNKFFFPSLCLQLVFFQVRAEASHILYEIVMQGVADQAKTHLATSQEELIWKKLHQRARLQAIAKAKGMCLEMEGSPAVTGCERTYRKEIVNVWGGRVGHEAYRATVTFTLRCTINEDHLNWFEENWLHYLYPPLSPCPSHRAFPVEQ
jgi:hypothetical protein